jgi:uncharacterized protein YidB (DUF937 family)
MGLLDILNTIQSGGGVSSDPRARPAPMPAGQSQGMSPIAKALLGLLAVYAAKNMGMGGPTPAQQPGGNIRAGYPGGGPAGEVGGGGLGDLLGGMLGGGRPGGAPGGGGLGDLLRGPLGGILGGAAAGTALNGGLGGLIDQFQRNGQGDAARSWVSPGPNKAISQDDLATALGADTIDMLAGQTGMDREEMLAGLSQQLPRFVDQLTPDGRLPTDEEAARLV